MTDDVSGVSEVPRDSLCVEVEGHGWLRLYSADLQAMRSWCGLRNLPDALTARVLVRALRNNLPGPAMVALLQKVTLLELVMIRQVFGPADVAQSTLAKEAGRCIEEDWALWNDQQRRQSAEALERADTDALAANNWLVQRVVQADSKAGYSPGPKSPTSVLEGADTCGSSESDEEDAPLAPLLAPLQRRRFRLSSISSDGAEAQVQLAWTAEDKLSSAEAIKRRAYSLPTDAAEVLSRRPLMPQHDLKLSVVALLAAIIYLWQALGSAAAADEVVRLDMPSPLLLLLALIAISGLSSLIRILLIIRAPAFYQQQRSRMAQFARVWRLAFLVAIGRAVQTSVSGSLAQTLLAVLMMYFKHHVLLVLTLPFETPAMLRRWLPVDLLFLAVVSASAPGACSSLGWPWLVYLSSTALTMGQIAVGLLLSRWFASYAQSGREQSVVDLHELHGPWPTVRHSMECIRTSRVSCP